MGIGWRSTVAPTKMGAAGVARRITLGWLAAFLAILLAFFAFLHWSGATTRLDRLLHDSFVRLHQQEAPTDIVIAAIDPASLATLGRWPWPRETQAAAFRELARLGARALVVDIVYTEAAREASADQSLADALAAVPTSILPVLLEGGIGRSASDNLPLPVLTRAATGLGHIFLPIDSDGIVRRINLKAGFRRAHWPALALAAHLETSPSNTGAATLPGKRHLPSEPPENVWVGDYEVLIPFYGPEGTFDRVSMVDLIEGRVERSAIDGKVVLVGLTTSGLGDVVPTPVSAQDRPLPGIEVHANVLASLGAGRLVSATSVWLGFLVAAVLLPVLLGLYSRAPPQWSLPLALIGAVIPIALSLALYSLRQLWFPPVSVSIAVLASYLAWSRHRLAFVNRFLEREQALLDPHVPTAEDSDQRALVNFFEHAVRHLPIVGWRFSALGSDYAGGEPISEWPTEIVGPGWRFRDGVHAKRYPTQGRLQVAFKLSDETEASEIRAYIDSLGRIRSRVRRSLLGGSLERLQSNAHALSNQLIWLRGVKEFSETVLAGSPMGFAVWNPAGEMVRGNALIEKLITGLGSRAQLIDFIKAIDRDPDEVGTRERLHGLLTRGEGWQLIYEASEQELVVDFSAVGNTLRERLICASVVDVTKMRTAERARAELVDYLSHDLRSPLISALYDIESDQPVKRLESDNTERHTGVTAPVHGEAEARQRIAGNIRRSLAMMDDLLHVARADSLDGSTFGELLFNAVLDNALDEMLPQATARGISLRVDSCDDELWMQGDANSLERAVSNIIGNAIKYSPDGSDVRITLKRLDDTDTLDLTVSDNGVGIDPDMIDQLFVRFRRDARVQGRFKGIGLGLALVSRVVGQHGGTVKAYSEGQGTDIVMQLPLMDAPIDV